MSDTIADIQVENTWVDVYATTGITVGATIYVVNKGNAAVRFYEQVAQPLDTDKDGVPLLPSSSTGKGATISDASGLWVKTNAKYKQYLSVQEVL